LNFDAAGRRQTTSETAASARAVAHLNVDETPTQVNPPQGFR
jgi:hypothetical protein